MLIQEPGIRINTSLGIFPFTWVMIIMMIKAKKLHLGIPLILLLAFQLPCLALFGFGKKKKKKDQPLVIEEYFLNDQTIIQKQFKSQLSEEEIYDINIVIEMPYAKNHMEISTILDELNKHQIKNIRWMVPGEESTKTYASFKVEQEVNESREKNSIDADPVAAYDRLSEGKHIVTQTFFFEKEKILGPDLKKKEHRLELSFADGSRKAIRIDNYIFSKHSHPNYEALMEKEVKEKKYDDDLIEPEAVQHYQEQGRQMNNQMPGSNMNVNQMGIPQGSFQSQEDAQYQQLLQQLNSGAGMPGVDAIYPDGVTPDMLLPPGDGINLETPAPMF